MSNQYLHGSPSDDEILLLWRGQKNTNEIAKQLWVPEHHIANRLPHVIQRARQDEEWNFDRTA